MLKHIFLFDDNYTTSTASLLLLSSSSEEKRTSSSFTSKATTRRRSLLVNKRHVKMRNTERKQRNSRSWPNAMTDDVAKVHTATIYNYTLVGTSISLPIVHFTKK